MKKIILKIQTAMKSEFAENKTPLFYLLYLLSLVYGCLTRFRLRLYAGGVLTSKKLPCRVISIGNLTVGGTGKTPMAIYVSEMVKSFGYKPAVISRGYKGMSEKRGGVVCNGQSILMSHNGAGDEPFMMARKLKDVPVLVGSDRYDIGMNAVKRFAPDVIVLDDGFQHCRLKRNIDLVLLDDRAPFGNGYLLPRGILRESISGLSRADACILTRSGISNFSNRKLIEQYVPGKPVFSSFHIPYIYAVLKENKHQQVNPDDFSFLSNADVFLFSGIAKNEGFRQIVKEKVKNVVGFFEYQDHHQYTNQDLRDINREAENNRADYIITTEKDFVRIENVFKSPVSIVIVGVRISFGNEENRFQEFIRKRMDNINSSHLRGGDENTF